MVLTFLFGGELDYEFEFRQVINDPANTIHFNLNGIDNVRRAIELRSKGYLGLANNYTNWELFMINSNPAALARTIFYKGGQIANIITF
jgi:hypothetical protein